MKHDDMGMGLKRCVAVYLLELVRLFLKYKLGTIFRSEWFWIMEELTKRNGKGMWLREIEKMLKRFDASLEWLMELIGVSVCQKGCSDRRTREERKVEWYEKQKHHGRRSGSWGVN